MRDMMLSTSIVLVSMQNIKEANPVEGRNYHGLSQDYHYSYYDETLQPEQNGLSSRLFTVSIVMRSF